MPEPLGEERSRLLDPLDRISEVLFGLVMAVTIVGSLAIGTAGKAEVRTVLIAALGCNVAWGLVDAVMYVLRGVAERARMWNLGQRVRESGAASGAHLIARALPDQLAGILGFGRYAGHARPWRMGVAMAVFGALLIAAVKALGG